LSLELIKAYEWKYESHFDSTGIVPWNTFIYIYLFTPC